LNQIYIYLGAYDGGGRLPYNRLNGASIYCRFSARQQSWDCFHDEIAPEALMESIQTHRSRGEEENIYNRIHDIS